MEAPARVRRGEPVPLVFRVTNSSREAVTLQLLGRAPAADFRVSDAQDRVAWTLLRGQTMLGALRLHQLNAGESLTFRHVWDQRDNRSKAVSPGAYRIVGILLTDRPGGVPSPAVKLRIDP